MKRVTVALILGAGLFVTDALAIAEEVLRVAQSTAQGRPRQARSRR